MKIRGCSHHQILSSVPRRSSVRVWFILWGLTTALVLVATPGFALDGRIELRGTHQEGRAGAEAYKTDSQWQIYSLSQRVQFSKFLSLHLDANARRERLWSSSVAGSNSTDRKILIPFFNLNYRDETYRFSFSGRASRIDQTGTGVPSRRDEYFNIGFWLTGIYDRWQWDSSLREEYSWRYSENSDRENRNHLATFGTRVDISQNDEMRYNFSRTKQDAVSFNSESTYISNNLHYRGRHMFAGDKGLFSATALLSRFDQTDHIDDVVGLEYVLPAFAGYVLDDTPEYLDPLEDDPISVPALFDKDRTTGTEINIGDNASVVRDYGGDYRNIILDFGDTQEMNTLILYVDTKLRFPGLMSWELFVSDSADGRDWSTALSPADYTITYTEWETGRQGWVVRLTSPINHRRIKMVNSKLGPTEPDILVTEFELYQTSVTTTPDRSSTTTRQRLDGQISYRIVPQLQVRYIGSYDRRATDTETGDLKGISNALDADYRFSHWSLAGRYDNYTLRGPSRRDTDTTSKGLSLSRSRRVDLYGQVSWNQTTDNSYGTHYTTTSMTGDVSWRIAPLLTLNQKASYSVRESQAVPQDSDSWALITVVRSTPKPNLSVDFRWSKRWVTKDFGTGFTNFTDSDLSGNWAITPYLHYNGQFVFQAREEDDWLIRNGLSWAPLPGGSMLLQFHARDHQDTRTDYMRRGGGVSATWKPRPRLNLSAGVEKFYEKIRGQRDYPVSYEFRGYWTF